MQSIYFSQENLMEQYTDCLHFVETHEKTIPSNEISSSFS